MFLKFRLLFSPARQRPSARPATAKLTSAVAVVSTVLLFLVLPAFDATAATNHNPVGSLDGVAFANGTVHVQGWTYDPDSSRSIITEVRMDNRIVTRTRADVVRLDIARRYPRYGARHGYAVDLAATNGRHHVCVVAYNIGVGSNRTIGCRDVVVDNNPVGGLDAPQQIPQGVRISGWTLDPNTKGAITAVLSVDGNVAARVTAAAPRASTRLPFYGLNHGFSVILPLALGTHRICLTGKNVGSGNANPQFPCKAVTVRHDPVGLLSAPSRPGNSGTLATVSGYALDLDTTAPISVAVAVDGVAQAPQLAAQPSPEANAAFPQYPGAHGFALTVPVPDGRQHRICLTLLNVGAGFNTALPCQPLLSNGDVTPSPVVGITGWPGSGRADITWAAARAVAAPILRYTIAGLPNGRVLQVSPDTLRATISGLRNGSRYTFVVTAFNDYGPGSSAPVTVTPSYVPPQFTPAPISTSHYPRNLTGNLVADMAMARAQGARDADANPSNHRYAILQDIGGQDELNGGVVLSATSIFRSYGQVLQVMQAYTDGYASRQRAYAPLLLAVGTNNDIDVSYSAGVSWSRQLIDPLSAYVSARHPGIEVAAANDIEPGFSGSAAASRSWVSGYLATSAARLVFNGSADGCSTIAPASRCNNGWTMADLQWLSGGASPTRIISLPQIYNSAMPLQWKNISLTGVNSGRPRLYFGGPLTEYTACAGGRRCYSVGGNIAWTMLWNAISSSPATAQYELPYSTDLMIN